MTFAHRTRIDGFSCSITIDRVHDRLILVRIDGHDVGEFGRAPMRSIESILPRDGAAKLFIDARQAKGVTVDVSGEWAQWLGRMRKRLAGVHMFAVSRLVQINAEFLRRFVGLEDQMVLYTDSAEFERNLLRSSAGSDNKTAWATRDSSFTPTQRAGS